MKILKLALASGVVSLAGVASASADMAVGLVGDDTLVMIDTVKPAVTKSIKVTGVDKLLGIDVRPSNMMLYGVTADGMLVTIDPATGAADWCRPWT